MAGDQLNDRQIGFRRAESLRRNGITFYLAIPKENDFNNFIISLSLSLFRLLSL